MVALYSFSFVLFLFRLEDVRRPVRAHRDGDYGRRRYGRAVRLAMLGPSRARRRQVAAVLVQAPARGRPHPRRRDVIHRRGGVLRQRREGGAAQVAHVRHGAAPEEERAADGGRPPRGVPEIKWVGCERAMRKNTSIVCNSEWAELTGMEVQSG